MDGERGGTTFNGPTQESIGLGISPETSLRQTNTPCRVSYRGGGALGFPPPR